MSSGSASLSCSSSHS